MFQKAVLVGALALASVPSAAALPRSSLVACDSCTFTSAAAVVAGKKSCSTITLNNIAVPAGTTLDLTGLNSGTKVIFKGTTSFGYKEWNGPLISVSGSNLDVSGASGHVIDGNGHLWWDGKGSNSGGKTKPQFFFAHSVENSNIHDLNVKNTPVQAFSINNARTSNFDNIVIDNSAGDTAGGHNTDGFDVGNSSGIKITGANVKNQDDCLAINSGSNIVFSGGTCSGGHGLSIGSVGGRADNVVNDVTISDSTVSDSENGVRIKTIAGAKGQVSNIVYSGITLSNISKYGVVIEQDYENGSPTGKPTTGVPINDLTLKDIKGTVKSSATEVYVLCGDGSCSDFKWSDVSVTGGQASTHCLNAPSSVKC